MRAKLSGQCTPDLGTSAEPEIFGDSSPAQKKKRRYSGTGLRRKTKDVRDGRGDLQYFGEADDAGYKGGREIPAGHKSDREDPGWQVSRSHARESAIFPQ